MKRSGHPRIVGIGASADGLNALEGLFRSLPADTGMAFVVVIHPRNFQGPLDTILAPFTAMPVAVAADGEPVKPGHVYVCPAGRIMTVKNGQLQLVPPEKSLRHFPIDQTMASLAGDCGESAIGVLLSGGGSDGAQGLRAIRERGGLTLAQAADGADRAYGQMMDAAIASRAVDLVLPAEAIGPRLATLARSPMGHHSIQPAAPGAESRKSDRSLVHAERELTEMRKRLQLMVEEYETAVENLKSSNEELESINRELRSTNVEMQTFRDELQSVNEELNTINIELHDRVDELNRANSDLHNVFESTQVAIIFLDSRLAVRTFTPAATAIFKLIADDCGRALTDIASNLRDTADLGRLARTVFEQGNSIERQVHHVDGHTHYSMRILPYRNERSVIAGTLIIFVDTTRQVEFEARQSRLLGDGNANIRTFLDLTSRIAGVCTERPAAERAWNGFQARLDALIASCDLFMRAGWEDVAVAAILQTALGGHLGRNSKRISIAGPDVLLAPAPALALGTVIHELTDNAARHGSLSHRKGELRVDWDIARIGSHNTLHIDWRESGGPAVARPRQKGPGRKLIDQMLKSDLRGAITIDYAPSGVKVRLSIPMGSRQAAGR